jgi:hypothetical protein
MVYGVDAGPHASFRRAGNPALENPTFCEKNEAKKLGFSIATELLLNNSG